MTQKYDHIFIPGDLLDDGILHGEVIVTLDTDKKDDTLQPVLDAHNIGPVDVDADVEEDTLYVYVQIKPGLRVHLMVRLDPERIGDYHREVIPHEVTESSGSPP